LLSLQDYLTANATKPQLQPHRVITQQAQQLQQDMMGNDSPILKHNLHEAHFGSDEMENIAAVKEGKKAISLTCTQQPMGVC